jgi:hypothetical protein
MEMTNVETLLREAELDAEKTSAVIRLVVFLSLALAVSSAVISRGPGFGAGTAVTLYGLGTAIGLLLAWRRIFHPIIPYLFVTFDVILVAAQVLLLAGLMGMQLRSAFMIPATALIFIILVHTSMRYRPWLVVYAAALFVVSIELGPLFLVTDRQGMMGDGVDAPRRHLCAKVTVSNCHRRRRPWSRLARSVWTSRNTCSSCMERMVPGMCSFASASLA